MLRTLLIVLILAMLPAAAAAEEDAPAADCTAVYDVFLPGTFGAEAARAALSAERDQTTKRPR